MSTNIVYFNLRLRVAGMYASLTKSNKKKKTPIKEESVYQFLLNQILETTIAPLIYLYYLEIFALQITR